MLLFFRLVYLPTLCEEKLNRKINGETETVKEIKILLVEDNKHVGEAIQGLLKRMGRLDESFWAKNLDEAEEFYQEHKKDLKIIFVDGDLHNRVSVPWVKKIASDFTTQGGALIAFSGSPELNKKLISAGCTAAIDKGLDILQTRTAIESRLGKKINK